MIWTATESIYADLSGVGECKKSNVKFYGQKNMKTKKLSIKKINWFYAQSLCHYVVAIHKSSMSRYLPAGEKEIFIKKNKLNFMYLGKNSACVQVVTSSNSYTFS